MCLTIYKLVIKCLYLTATEKVLFAVTTELVKNNLNEIKKEK